MSWEAWLSLAVLGVVFVGLLRNIAADLLLVGAVTVVTLAGIITPKEAFVGFSNKGMLTVGALYIVAAGLRETGALAALGNRILGGASSEKGVLLRLAGAVTAMSAFLNNTPIVSMFIPIVSDWSRKNQVAPSRLLMPLSFFCILGGTCTLIGTSTNLVVDGLMQETVKATPALAETLHPMGLFELGYVGLPYAIIGITYMLVVGHRLLPTRMDFLEQLSNTSRDYLVNLEVEAHCPLIGKEIQAAGLRRLPGLFLIEIQRKGQIISPVTPHEVIQESDLLTFTGVISTLVDLDKISGLTAVADKGSANVSLKNRERMLCEAVVSGNCPAVGITVRDADFRALYNAAIVAVHRGSERLRGRVGDIVLQPGDTLLLQTGPHFARAHRNNPDFLLVGGVENSQPVRHNKMYIAMGLLALLMLLMTTGHIPIILAAFLTAGLMIATRCLSTVEARQSIDWQTLITIAAAFGLGNALVASGLVDTIARSVVDFAGPLGPHAVLAGVYLMTTLFTETVTNNAAAALVFPFAISMAQQLECSPRPFALAVAFAASASFITPLGYQTNLMVFGPGGYRFGDFVKVGLPLNLLLFLAATLLIPLAWPF